MLAARLTAVRTTTRRYRADGLPARHLTRRGFRDCLRHAPPGAVRVRPAGYARVRLEDTGPEERNLRRTDLHQVHDVAGRRYEQLLTYHLTAPWSSANNRFCTSEMKTQVILPELLRRFPTDRIVSVVGIRREESIKRRLTPVSKPEAACWTRKRGANILTWNPGVDVREDEVYAYCERHSLPLPESYDLGSTRHGCAFCVLASENDIRVAAHAPGNRGTLFHLVEREAVSTFSFQSDRWLGDVARDILPASLAADHARGKILGTRRRQLEASLPANLRYVKGWPQRIPTIEEAVVIADVRARILAMHQLETPYPSPSAVRDRIAELFDEQRLKEAA
jgi:3'-phosphoadenosine 5'-phosphosulfate sulfotransferase (PAPS reductase)/FAD synthetase